MSKLKKLIVVGGNSNLTQSILKLNNLNYKEIFILCHRKYNGIEKINFKIIENIKPDKIKKTIYKIFNNNSCLMDIIVANTPSKNSDYKLIKTREWSLVSINLMSYISKFKNLNKIIFTFSSLALIPFINKSAYKNIKNIEINYYLNFRNNDKIIVSILPPLNKGDGIGKFFSEPLEIWSTKIVKAFDNSNYILYPTGINGIITKIIFTVWSKF